MANPKFRISASRRDRRRSHLALKPITGSVCKNCGSVCHPHRACASCGHYKGRQIMKGRASAESATQQFQMTNPE